MEGPTNSRSVGSEPSGQPAAWVAAFVVVMSREREWVTHFYPRPSS